MRNHYTNAPSFFEKVLFWIDTSKVVIFYLYSGVEKKVVLLCGGVKHFVFLIMMQSLNDIRFQKS